MKVSLLFQTPKQTIGEHRMTAIRAAMAFLLFVVFQNLAVAEGSKDFVTYPGYRMFLDTRDSQQLKVYAGAGEFINVGSSHIGIQGGYIQVFRPDGTLAATFDNTGGSSGLGIINNNVQEMAGPNGGGTTNGTGYIPGVVQVPAGQAGIWTVVFDYPSYVNTSFINIQNNAPWTRGANQPNSRRVVLAWDVTVTSGGAGNSGGTVHEGRLYSNEHISLINGNGFKTSPIFYVLTDDGYLYEVDINEADPFRFPISSNSLGLVNGNGAPIYKSKPESAFSRSGDPSGWAPNSIYLYEPQAQDDQNLGLINNKIFFNIPDAGLPTSALVTDIFRNNTHTTWLYGALQVLNLSNFTIAGANPGGPPCAPNTFQVGKGGYFIFDTNTGGSITLQLDLNNNGTFNDPADVTLMGVLNNGIDSIFWDGFDGLGVQIPAQDSFEFNYQGTIRFGEIHIALTDVENNDGGVTFNWLNAPSGYQTDLFYYDHSDVGGPVSGGGTPGHALPTTIPFTYTGNSGNDDYLDQWSFIEYPIVNTHAYINIVVDCVCENATPVLAGDGDGDHCAGTDLTLTATNTFPGIGDLTYTWSGPAAYSFIDPAVGVNETSTAVVNNITSANAGTYQVIAATVAGCSDTLIYSINVNPTPNALNILGGGDFCAGADVVLTATNIVPGISMIHYEWSGPGVPVGMESGDVVANSPITLAIPNIQSAAEGTYSLTLTSELGCVSSPISTTINVDPTPVLSAVSGGGNYCVDDDVTLTATNSAAGISTMTCVWSGPNGLNITQNVAGNAPINLSLTNINNSFEGTYTLICTVGACPSAPLTFNVDVNATPEINAISPNGSFCAGSSVTLTAQNITPGTGDLNYTWTGPNGFVYTSPTAIPEDGDFTAIIPNLTAADAGVYTLVLTALGGCQSVPQSVTVGVLPSPEITITGGGDVCIGQDVVLTATNSTSNLGPINYIWTDPNGNVIGSGITDDDVPCTVTVTNVDANDGGVYTIQKTAVNNGCSTTATVSLNVLPGLNIINPTPDSTYCEFQSVVLTATNTVAAGDLTYSWTGPNGQVLGPFTVGSLEQLIVLIPEAGMEDSGTWTLNATSTVGCNATIQVQVTVNPGVQIATITGGGQYCINAPVNLNGTGEGSATTVTYTWTDPSGNVIFTGNTTAAGPFPASGVVNLTGSYVLEVVANPSGCSDTDSVDIEFNALPEVTILNNDTTLCDLDTLEICGQALTPNMGNFSYVWTTPNSQSITGDASGNAPFCDIISPLEDYGDGIYTLVITANGCTSEPDSFVVNLNPNPQISILSGGGTYCEGDTAIICFTNINPEVVGYFYTCILPDGTQTTGQTTTNETICIPLTESGTFSCSLESVDGCVSSLASVTVTFEPSAELSVSANTPVCANDTLLLTGSNSLPCTGTISYMWTGPNGFMFMGTAPCGGPFTAEVVNPVSGQYCLIAPLSSNCPDTACVDVTVNPVPMVVNNTISGGGTFCEGEDVTLTAQVTISDNTAITYVWCKDDVPISGQTGTVASGTTVTLDLGQVNADDEGEYCLKLTSINGCTNNPPTCVTVEVNPSPEILTVSGGGTYCEGVDVSLNGTGKPGLPNVTYMWMGPNGFVFNGPSVPSQGPFPATISDIEVLDAGIYTLIVKLGDCQDSMSVVVEVNPKPIINIITGSTTTCAGSPVTISFEIDPNGADTVTWNVDSPNFDTSGVVTTTTTITFQAIVDATTTFTITAESNDGCEAEPQEVVITVQELDPPTLTPSNVIICPGDDLVLTSTPYSGDVTYEWFKDGVSLGTTDVPEFTVNPPMTGVYTVEVTVDGCSATSAGVSVTAPTAPDAVDDEYTSNVVGPVNGNVTDNDSSPSPSTATVLTQPTSGTVEMNEDGTFTYTPGNPVVPQVTFTYELCLADCPDVCDQATVTINIVVECIIPNVITPNGDNVNDVLIINCVPPDGTSPNNTRLRVFNRWGDEIAAFEPYLNEEGWDGTYGDSKKPVPAATYFYLFEFDKTSGDKPQAGYIKVQR